MNVYQLSAKNCMSHLLLKDTFDTFLFIEGEFTTFNKFTISGYLQEDFFDEKLEETYSRWETLFCKKHHNIIASLATNAASSSFRINGLCASIARSYNCLQIILCISPSLCSLHTVPADDLHSGSVYFLYPYPFHIPCHTSSSFPAYGGSLLIMSS